MDTWDLLLQIILLLLACFAAGGLMAMLRHSPLVGFLLAGLIVGGPGSLAIVRAESAIEGLAELGVALLLFSLGLEFSWQRVLGLGFRTLICRSAAGAGDYGCADTDWPQHSTQFRRQHAPVRRHADPQQYGNRGWSSGGSISAGFAHGSQLHCSPAGAGHGRGASSGTDTTAGQQRRQRAMLSRILGILLAGGGVVIALYLLLNLLAVRVMRTRSIGQNRELMVLLSGDCRTGDHVVSACCRTLTSTRRFRPACISATHPSPCRFVRTWHHSESYC
jgi:hypothetical protein